MLKSDDDFTVLKAVKFLVAYEDKSAVDAILEAMEKSSMSENIAGEVPYLESLLDLMQTKKKLQWPALTTFCQDWARFCLCRRFSALSCMRFWLI